MEVRSYYASTLEAAIAMARRELGPEALLIQSQRTAPEWLHLGRYEAVFAGEILAVPSKPRSSPALLPVAAHSPPAATLTAPAGRPDFRALFQSASRTTSNSQLAGQPIACNADFGGKGSAVTIALVGPSGAGKTVTAMKLALRYGVLASRTARLLAFDPDRVGATRQMRHFAGLFGISFTHCESISQLQTVLAAGSVEITLIDTPGFSGKQAAQREQLAACLRCFSTVEAQLVLRLDRKTEDNVGAVDRFSCFRISRVILTALDETSDFTDLPLLLARANAPVSFLGTGQHLLDDLEPAMPQRLSEMILGGFPKSLCAIA